MTEEQNKLAEEIERILAEYHRAVELDDASLLPKIMSQWCDLFFKPGASAILAALREPATEAVLEEPCRYCNAQGNDPCAYPEGCKRLDNLVLRMLNTAIHSDIKHPPAGSLLREAVRAIRKLALKGKGASQGDGLAKLAALPSEMQTLAESLAPEPSGEMSDQHRILLGAAISISNALHNEEMRGAKLKASTDTAWEKLSLAIEHSSAILAPMSRRDEDAKR